MRLLLIASSFALLAGCTRGYLIDDIRPKEKIIGPQFARFGLTAEQSACLASTVDDTLSPWQLRQLATAASGVQPGYTTPGRLTVADLVWVARSVNDPKVPLEIGRAVDACGMGGVDYASAEQTSRPAATMPADGTTATITSLTGLPPPGGDAPTPAATITNLKELPAPDGSAAATAAATAAAAGTIANFPPPPPGSPAALATWVNLGAAATGQLIAVDASSIEKDETHRQAWFRMHNPGEPAPAASSYLLRIDCGAKTINSMASRSWGPTGRIADLKDLRPAGEGAVPVEAGTVMEIAYLSLCT